MVQLERLSQADCVLEPALLLYPTGRPAPILETEFTKEERQMANTFMGKQSASLAKKSKIKYP